MGLMEKAAITAVLLSVLFLAVVATDGITDSSDATENIEYTDLDGISWYFRIIDGGAEITGSSNTKLLQSTSPVTTALVGFPETITVPEAVFVGEDSIPVVSVADNAFCSDPLAKGFKTELRNVVIPDTVVKVGNGAFSGHLGLQEIIFENTGGVSQLRFVGNYAFGIYEKNADWITRLVDKVAYLMIPDSVEVIGDCAFNRPSTVNISQNSKLTSVGDMAFAFSEGTVNLTSGVISLGVAPFGQFTNLTSHNTRYLTIENELIDNDTKTLICVFGNHESHTVSSTVRCIAPYAFYATNIVSLNIPDNVENIEEYAFSYSNGLKSIVIPEGMTEIRSHTFSNSFVERLSLPGTIGVINDNAFERSDSLISIEFGDSNGISSLTYLGYNCFLDCKKLETVTFGKPSSTVGEFIISDGAFRNCDSLEKIIFDSSLPVTHIGDYAFCKSSGNDLKQIRQFGPADYQMFFNKTVSYIGDYAFSSCGMSGSVFLASSGNVCLIFAEDSELTYLGEYSFTRLTGLYNYDLSNCVRLESIGTCAFKQSGISSTEEPVVILPPNLRVIGDSAFEKIGPDYQQFREVLLEIPKTVEYVGECAFDHDHTCWRVSFQSQSQLKTLGSMAFTAPIDLSNYPSYSIGTIDLTSCVNLNSVGYNNEAVYNLPPGTVINFTKYVYFSGVWKEVDMSSLSHLYPNVLFLQVDTTGVGETYAIDYAIGCDVSVIDGRIFDHAIRSIECNSGNSYFEYTDSCLFAKTNPRTVLKYLGDESIVSFDDAVVIGKNAFSGNESVKILVFVSDVEVKESSFVDMHSIEAIVFKQPISNSSVYNLYGLRSNTFICVNDDFTNIDLLKKYGKVLLGYGPDNSLYLPMSVDDIHICYSDIHSDSSIVSFRADFDSGYTCYDVYLFDLITEQEIDSIDQVYSGNFNGDVIVCVKLKSRCDGDLVCITFDSNGGIFEDGTNQFRLEIPVGLSIIDREIPVAFRDGYYLTWIGSGNNAFDFSKPVTSDTNITAEWTARAPTVFLQGDVHGDVHLVDNSGRELVFGQPISSSTLRISFLPTPSYELLYTDVLVDGELSRYYGLNYEITIESNDVIIHPIYRYISISAPLTDLIDTGLPTSDEIADVVKVWTIGGKIDMSNMSSWKGHTSVPLIVDDYVFLRISDRLYKFETETGYLIKSVESSSDVSYYHYVYYGGGFVIDNLTHQAYDLDLNPVYRIPDSIDWVYYHDGYFYSEVNGVLYKFDSSDGNASVSNEIKTLERVAETGPVFVLYGQSPLIFAEDHIYLLSTSSDSTQGSDLTRRLVSVDKDNNVNSVLLTGIEGQWLDDGWLSYNNGALYLTSYQVGLFGAQNSTSSSTITIVPLVNGEFGAPNYQRIVDDTSASRSLTTNFVIFNGRGYVASSSRLFVYDLETMNLIYSEKSVLSHGGITIDTSYACADNNWTIYIYNVGYDMDSGVCVHTDNASKVSASSPIIAYIPDGHQYCSQPIRSDDDGRMIWYNDTGHAFCYALPSNNHYYFFVEDNGMAIWYDCTGSSAAQALSKLGSNVVVLGDNNELISVNNKTSGFEIYVWYGVLDQQWVKLDNLFDAQNDCYHYYVITNTGIPDVGSFWSVSDGNNVTVDYEFRNNIGDRAVLGKALYSLEASVGLIKFYDGDVEIPNSEIRAVVQESFDGTFPDISKKGFILSWKDDNGSIVNELPTSMPSGVTNYYAEWVNCSFAIKIDNIDNSGELMELAISITPNQNYNVDGMSLLIIKNHSGGYSIERIQLDVNGNDVIRKTIAVETDGLSYCMLYVVRGTNTDEYVSYGYLYYDLHTIPEEDTVTYTGWNQGTAAGMFDHPVVDVAGTVTPNNTTVDGKRTDGSISDGHVYVNAGQGYCIRLLGTSPTGSNASWGGVPTGFTGMTGPALYLQGIAAKGDTQVSVSYDYEVGGRTTTYYHLTFVFTIHAVDASVTDRITDGYTVRGAIEGTVPQGYELLGWTTVEGGTDVQYAEGAQAEPGLTLYPVFEPIGNGGN